MSDNPTNREPYQQAYYPPVPTGFTRYMRTSVWWQPWRFIVINWKCSSCWRIRTTDRCLSKREPAAC
jgi:hypothetical protein